MDFCRKVLAFRLSNTLTADFCVEALEEGLANFGRPEIFNTDQGSQTLTKTEEEETIIINRPDISTYPEEKSVSEAEPLLRSRTLPSHECTWRRPSRSAQHRITRPSMH